MRGEAEHAKYRRMIVGITPAHAGRRGQSPNRSRCSWDHPRACGEKGCSLKGFAIRLKSPPRMRGEGCMCRHLQFCERITPAHAGRRTLNELLEEVNRDHPRACGEKKKGDGILAEGPGSPPRMRGEDEEQRAVVADCRITPAHAGRSRRIVRVNCLCQDHPRACGEKQQNHIRRAV